MKTLCCLFAVSALFAGALALAAAAPAPSDYDHYCRQQSKVCLYEPGPNPCPPCQELRRCAPCICRQIPGCTI